MVAVRLTLAKDVVGTLAALEDEVLDGRCPSSEVELSGEDEVFDCEGR